MYGSMIQSRAVSEPDSLKWIYPSLPTAAPPDQTPQTLVLLLWSWPYITNSIFLRKGLSGVPKPQKTLFTYWYERVNATPPQKKCGSPDTPVLTRILRPGEDFLLSYVPSSSHFWGQEKLARECSMELPTFWAPDVFTHSQVTSLFRAAQN